MILIQLIALASFIAIYMAPTIIANYKQMDNANSIAVLNIFLGWTFIGWVIALFMAFAPTKKSY